MDTKITIHNREYAVGDSDATSLLSQVIQKAVFQQQAHKAHIWVYPRRADGWLEFLLICGWAHLGNGVTISCIQRKLGAEFEFHS